MEKKKPPKQPKQPKPKLKLKKKKKKDKIKVLSTGWTSSTLLFNLRNHSEFLTSAIIYVPFGIRGTVIRYTTILRSSRLEEHAVIFQHANLKTNKQTKFNPGN